MMDDYYNLQFDNIIEKKYQYLLNKKIKKIVLTSKLVLTLSHEMSSYYEREFNKKIETLMLGSNTKKIKIKSQKNKIKNLSYIGNISNQRYLNLIDIGKALDDINKEENKNYLLNIYSNVQDDSILNLFKTVESIKYWGFVKGKEYERAINNADILIHVESFNDETIDLIKHSISTKISESLSSGKCLLAYGPSNVASFSFLNNTNSAFIINKDDDLKYKLQQLLNDDKLRKKIIDNAYKTVEKYQNAEKNSKILYNLLERINSI